MTGGVFMLRVRTYVPADREFVLSLAPRLAIGIPPWRNQERMVATARQWIVGSIEQHGQKTMVFVAEDEQGKRLGFAAVSHHAHFTGCGQAYLGELVTSEAAEGHGVGKALVAACEQWAREQGYAFLSLTTGADNDAALGFYRHLGYFDEDITLIKQL